VAGMAAALTVRHAKGDRIGLWSENNPFFVTAYLAIIRAGLVVVPFQTDLPQETFEKIARDTGMTEMLASKRFGNRVRAWSEKAGVALTVEGDGKLAGDPAAAAWPAIDPRRDIAALMFASGSTGTPKGVMVSHRNIECNTRDIIQ